MYWRQGNSRTFLQTHNSWVTDKPSTYIYFDSPNCLFVLLLITVIYQKNQQRKDKWDLVNCLLSVPDIINLPGKTRNERDRSFCHSRCNQRDNERNGKKCSFLKNILASVRLVTSIAKHLYSSLYLEECWHSEDSSFLLDAKEARHVFHE